MLFLKKKLQVSLNPTTASSLKMSEGGGGAAHGGHGEPHAGPRRCKCRDNRHKWALQRAAFLNMPVPFLFQRRKYPRKVPRHAGPWTCPRVWRGDFRQSQAHELKAAHLPDAVAALFVKLTMPKLFCQQTFPMPKPHSSTCWLHPRTKARLVGTYSMLPSISCGVLGVEPPCKIVPGNRPPSKTMQQTILHHFAPGHGPPSRIPRTSC